MANKKKVNPFEELLKEIRERIEELNGSSELAGRIIDKLDELVSSNISARDQLTSHRDLLMSLSEHRMPAAMVRSFEKTATFLLEKSGDQLLREDLITQMFQEQSIPKVKKRRTGVKEGVVEAKLPGEKGPQKNGRRRQGKESKTETKVKEKKTPKKKGLDPYSSRILPAILSSEEIPSTLDGALLLTYGVDWKNQRIGGIGPGGVPIKGAKMGEEIAFELLRKNYLASAHSNLLLASKHPRKANVALTNVWKLTKKHPEIQGDLTKLSKKFHAWGVELKVPKK